MLLLITASLLFPSGIASAGDRDHHEGKHWKDDGGGKHWKDHDREDRQRHHRYADGCFRDEHLRVIRGYYNERGLPPGLAKKYYRTGQLPPGWERRVQPFPVEVERSLPPVCSECARGYVDGYAVVYQPRTRFVIDVHAVFGN